MTERQGSGWYPDPIDDSAEIYWDGIQWHGRREKFVSPAPPSNPTPQSPQPTETQSRPRRPLLSLSFSDDDGGDWRSWLGTGRRAPQSETSLRNVFDFGASGKKLNEKRLRIVAVIGLALMVLFIARDCSDRFNGATPSTRPTVTKAPTSAVAPGWLGTPLPTVLAPSPTVAAPPPTEVAPSPTVAAPPPTEVAPSPPGPDKQINDRLNELGIDATFTTIQGPEGQEVTAEFDIPENLTEGMIKSGARQDTIDILEYAKATYPNASQVRVTGSYPLTDDYGNTSTEIVINLTYLKSTLDKINFNGVASENIWELADRGYIVPAFRP